MWPKLLKLKLLFTDEMAFDNAWDSWVVKVRTVVMALGAAVAVYGNDIAENLDGTISVKKVKLIGIAIMAAALALRAGDKTPANVKALADDIKPGG